MIIPEGAFIKKYFFARCMWSTKCYAQEGLSIPPFFVNSASQYAWFTLDTIFRVDIAEGIWKAVSVYIWCKDVEEGGSY